MEFEQTNQDMMEEVNTTEDFTETDDDLFADDEVENQDEDQEESQSEEEAEDQEETLTADEDSNQKPWMEIKYNGEVKKLSEDDAKILAQKGMNYDHVKQEYDQLKNSEEIQLVHNLAAAAGMTVTQYVETMRQYQSNAELMKTQTSLKEQFPEASDELLAELAKSRVDANKRSMEEQKRQTETETKQKDDLQFQRQYEAFTSAYPDVDVTKLPEEVIQGIAQGETLLGAYRGYELAKVKAENAALKTNSKNRMKNIGSVKTADKTADYDAFLDGFENE